MNLINLKFLGLPAPRMVYVESFARVKTLSVSAKLLRSLVDRQVVAVASQPKKLTYIRQIYRTVASTWQERRVSWLAHMSISNQCKKKPKRSMVFICIWLWKATSRKGNIQYVLYQSARKNLQKSRFNTRLGGYQGKTANFTMLRPSRTPGHEWVRICCIIDGPGQPEIRSRNCVTRCVKWWWQGRECQ